MPWRSGEHRVMIMMGGADGPADQADDSGKDAGPESNDEDQCRGHGFTPSARGWVTIIGAER
jgi:hypothetical protein